MSTTSQIRIRLLGRLVPVIAATVVTLLCVASNSMALPWVSGPFPGGPQASQANGIELSPGGVWLKDHFDFRLEGNGNSSDDAFSSVDYAGDWNNDGIGDYVVGRWDHGSGGQACIIFGKKKHATKEHSNINDVPRICVESGGDADLGTSVAGGLDVGGPVAKNGKAIPDVVVGGQDLGSDDEGGAYVLFGQDCQNKCPTPGINGTANGPGWELYIGSDEVGGDAGSAVAMTPDMTGDGKAEIIVGDVDNDPTDASTNCNWHGYFHCGAAWVVSAEKIANGDPNSGGNLDTVAMFRIDGPKAESCSPGCGWTNEGHAGKSVAGGDINHDGLGDVVIGVPDDLDDESGGAYVVFGKKTAGTVNLSSYSTDGPGGGFVIQGASSDEELGYTVSVAPDMNGDKLPEVVVGNPSAYNDKGAAYVVFGKKTGGVTKINNSGSWGFSVVGASDDDGDYLAAGGLAGAGDFNGDGRGDFIVGGPGSDETSPKQVTLDENFGAVWVVYGKPDTGQIDLASYADRAKFVRIEGEDGTANWEPMPGDEFGGDAYNYRSAIDQDYHTHMIAAGDVNADGQVDILGSAPWWDSSGNDNASAVYTVLNTGLSYGEGAPNDEFGGKNYTLTCGKQATPIEPEQLSGFAGPNDDRTASVTKELPEGLSIDPKTAVISGTPTVKSDEKTYYVNLTNNYTTAVYKWAPVNITIEDSPDCQAVTADVIEEPGDGGDGPQESDTAQSAPTETSAAASGEVVTPPVTTPVPRQPVVSTQVTPPTCASSLKIASSRSVKLAKRLRIRLKGPKRLRAGSGSGQSVYRVTVSGRRAKTQIRKLVRMVKFKLGSQRLTSDALQPFTVKVRNDLNPGFYVLRATVVRKGKKKPKRLTMKISVVKSCK